jgi:hypothetical protein
MLRTASSLPLTGLLTLGFDQARFQTRPPACYRASWQLPGPDSHRQATTSLRTQTTTMRYVTWSPPFRWAHERSTLASRKLRCALPHFCRDRDHAILARRSTDSYGLVTDPFSSFAMTVVNSS